MLPPSTPTPRPRALGRPPAPSFHRRVMSMYLPNDHLDVPSIQIDSPSRPSLYTTFSGDEDLSLLASNPKWKLKRHLPDLGNKQAKRRSLATATVMGWLEDVEPPQPAQKATFGRLPRSPALQTTWLHPLTDEHLEKARKDRRQPRRPRQHQPEVVRSGYSKVFDHAPQPEVERVVELERPKHKRGLLGSLKHGLSKSISFRSGLATKDPPVVNEVRLSRCCPLCCSILTISCLLYSGHRTPIASRCKPQEHLPPRSDGLPLLALRSPQPRLTSEGRQTAPGDAQEDTRQGCVRRVGQVVLWTSVQRHRQGSTERDVDPHSGPALRRERRRREAPPYPRTLVASTF